MNKVLLGWVWKCGCGAYFNNLAGNGKGWSSEKEYRIVYRYRCDAEHFGPKEHCSRSFAKPRLFKLYVKGVAQ